MQRSHALEWGVPVSLPGDAVFVEIVSCFRVNVLLEPLRRQIIDELRAHTEIELFPSEIEKIKCTKYTCQVSGVV